MSEREALLKIAHALLINPIRRESCTDISIPYLSQRKLGSGSEGEVYEQDDKRVVKMLPIWNQRGIEGILQALINQQIAANAHLAPKIHRVEYCRHTDSKRDVAYIEMDRMGDEWKDISKDDCAEIREAMTKLHKLGIVHGDPNFNLKLHHPKNHQYRFFDFTPSNKNNDKFQKMDTYSFLQMAKCPVDDIFKTPSEFEEVMEEY